MVEKPRDSADPYVITIIGGGASATSAVEKLGVLVKNKPSLADVPIKLQIIESSDQLFRGLAWNPDYLRPWHLINQYSNSAINDVENQIIDQLRGQGRDVSALTGGNAKYYESSRALHSITNDLASKHNLEFLAKKGIQIETRIGTTVEKIKKDGERYQITMRDNKGQMHVSHTDYIQLSTGHWQELCQKGEQKHPGYFPSPWPASALETITSNQDIAVMGSGLSAVDAALTLAHKAGRFERDATDHLRFIPNEDVPHFKIHMYSPHGMLPDVMGHLAYGTRMSIKRLRTNSVDQLFSDVRTNYERVYDHAAQASPLDTLFHGDPAMEKAVANAYAHYRRLGAETVLRQQVIDAKESLEQHTQRPQEALVALLAVALQEARLSLGAEDIRRFDEHLQSIYSKYAVPMVMTNAEQMLALMEANCLSVHALGQTSSVSKIKGATGAEIMFIDDQGETQKRHFAAVVNATGDKQEKLRYASPLMCQLFEDQVLTGLAIPYNDPIRGMRDFLSEEAVPYEARKVICMGNQFASDIGGISQAEDGSAATVEGKKSRIFPTGQLLTYKTPFIISENAAKEDAKHAIETIISEITERYRVAQEEANRVAQEAELLRKEGERVQWYRYSIQNGDGKPHDKILCAVPPEVSQKRKQGLVRGIANALGVSESDVECISSEYITPRMRAELKKPSPTEISFP